MKLFNCWTQRLFLALMLIAPMLAHAAEVPMLTRHVTDQTGTLTAEQVEQLDQQLVALEKRKGAQLVVLIVSTTAPQDIESYSLAVAEANKIGRKGTDDGLLLLVAKDDHRDRIEVGYGLEGAVPDAAARRIQREFIESRFKQGDFFGGISAGVDQLSKLIDGEQLPPPTQRSGSNEGSSLGAIIAVSVITLLMPAMILRMIVGTIIGRRGLIPRMSVGAVLMSLLALFTQGSLGAVLVGAVMGAVFLAIPLGVINISSGSGRSSRGGFGGGSSRGGGGGGFSGGGGSFGGGGSSGSW